MKRSINLREHISRINGKSYALYKELRGSYQFDDYDLSLDRIQGDPFAPPSNLSLHLPFKSTGIPESYIENKHRRIALQDHLTRRLSREMEKYAFKAKGSGKSGLLSISRCEQTVLERTACQISRDQLIVRFHAGFPANGRRINGNELHKILFDFLPRCVETSLFYKNIDKEKLQQAIDLADDQHFIRQQLEAKRLVAFVADGAILPRQSGVSDKPMKNGIPFLSPESLRVQMELPHKGKLAGMGIRRGITLIAGGGYHGKSTLLNALEQGVYDHIAGDGREYVITDETAVKLRSEDGRFIKDVDISMFINDLPNGKDTHRFSTLDASGSTSQAAGIAESIEAGSRVFLIDEDTSATNFMVRDEFMQEVISRDKEPITPFIERARQINEKAGISTILVAGSCGSFFHIADTILQMDAYKPQDITARVKGLCAKYPAPDRGQRDFLLPAGDRVFTCPAALERERKQRPLKTKVHDKDGFYIGKEFVDLRYAEQLVDREQTAALAHLLRYALEQAAGNDRAIRTILDDLGDRLRAEGLEGFFSGSAVCGFAMPRRQEIAICLNRFRR